MSGFASLAAAAAVGMPRCIAGVCHLDSLRRWNAVCCCVQVRQTLAAKNLLVGALCWMTAAEGYYNDGYTLYASSPEMQPLTSMCAQINRPRPA